MEVLFQLDMLEESERRASKVLEDARAMSATCHEKEVHLNRQVATLQEGLKKQENAISSERETLEQELQRLKQLEANSFSSIQKELQEAKLLASTNADVAAATSSAAKLAQKNEENAKEQARALHEQVESLARNNEDLKQKHEQELSATKLMIDGLRMQLEKVESDLQDAQILVEEANAAKQLAEDEQIKLSKKVSELQKELRKSQSGLVHVQESMSAREELGRRLLKSEGDLRKELDNIRVQLSEAREQEKEMEKAIKILDAAKNGAEEEARTKQIEIDAIRRIFHGPAGGDAGNMMQLINPFQTPQPNLHNTTAYPPMPHSAMDYEAYHQHQMRQVNFHSPSSVPSPLDIKSSSNLSEVKLEQEVSALRIENYELHSKLGLERGQLSRERDEQIYKTNKLVRLLSELKTEVDGLLCRCGREEHIVDIGTDSTYIGICEYLKSALVFMQEE